MVQAITRSRRSAHPRASAHLDCTKRTADAVASMALSCSLAPWICCCRLVAAMTLTVPSRLRLVFALRNIADIARIDRLKPSGRRLASMALPFSTAMPRQPRRPAGPVSQHAVQHVLSRNAYLQPTAPLRPSQPLLVDADVAALASLCFCGPSQR